MILLLSLRRLDLRGSNSLMETPDFTEMPNLENLIMSGCTSLKEVHHSLRCSRKLIKLNLSHCINLLALPSIAQLGALRYLDLSECRRLTQLPELPPELYTLHADCHMALKSIHNLVTKKKKSQRLIFTPLSYGTYNDSIYNSFAHALFQNISSLQHDISDSDSLSLRVFTIEHAGQKKIPSLCNSLLLLATESSFITNKFLFSFFFLLLAGAHQINPPSCLRLC
ncbi:hypothetical protein MTR67_019607 [Solanum verrucosum]|uniref:Uncharacterized protein n=2 Tax=Solanum TaxID=4107 RepID=A0AAF0QP21_SOLVR|nr:hypothetical protein MTR67_019607 [Solanum verrucosum]